MIRKVLSTILAATLVLALSSLSVACSGQGDTPNAPNTPNASGTTDTPTSTTPATPISITDMTGRTVTLEKPAEKVVVLTASACEIVYAIGAGTTVVGRGEYCDWPAEALAIPAVQSGSETNIEQIIALAPDLVLTATMDQTPEQVQRLENAGIAAYASNASDIAGTYESILQIGTLMGKDAEAQAVVDAMKATFADIASNKPAGTDGSAGGNAGGSDSGTAGEGEAMGAGAGPDSSAKTVYFEVSPLEYGLWAAGNSTFMNEIAEIIGLENIFADVSGWVEVSEEQILERNPDYIVTIGMYFGEGPTPTDEILGRPSWQNITAVQEGRVLNLADNELSRPAPRLADGAQALFDFINGK